MAAQPRVDLTALAGGALRELIRSCLPHGPVVGAADQWRFGAVSQAARASLRSYFPQSPVPAAVLVPIVDRADGLTLLLTQRAGHLKNHAGQISFPGGRIEPDDESPLAAALRETEEEIGLRRDRVEIVGFLPDHMIVSGYRVTPVVGFIEPGFTLRLDRTEVAEAFEVPLAFLLDPRNHVPRIRRFEGHDIELTDMPWGERNIWGATAGMIHTLYRILCREDE